MSLLIIVNELNSREVCINYYLYTVLCVEAFETQTINIKFEKKTKKRREQEKCL